MSKRKSLSSVERSCSGVLQSWGDIYKDSDDENTNDVRVALNSFNLINLTPKGNPKSEAKTFNVNLPSSPKK